MSMLGSLLMLALLTGGVTAMAQAPARGPGSGAQGGPQGERSRRPALSPPGERPPGPPDGATEPMDGPDAWELLGLGPFGLSHRGPAGPPRGGSAMRFNAFSEHQRDLEQRLGVTPAQHAHIEAILDAQECATAVQRRSLEALMRQMQDLLRSAGATRAAIELKIDAVARARAELTKSRLRALLDTRSVLTAAQRAKLAELGDELRPRGGPPRH